MSNDSATALKQASHCHSLGMESKHGTCRMSAVFNILRDEFDIFIQILANRSYLKIKKNNNLGHVDVWLQRRDLKHSGV